MHNVLYNDKKVSDTGTSNPNKKNSYIPQDKNNSLANKKN